MLMIHGACTDSDFFLESASALSLYYEAVIYDRRGSGRSTVSDSADCSVECQAEDAADILRTIGRPAHIIAHSGGTAVAMTLAQAHPELVRRIILHEPVDYDCRSPRDEAELQQIAALIGRKKYNSALAHFMERIGKADPRARKATDGELDRLGGNCKHFIRREFESFMYFTSDAEILKDRDIVIGLGELSRGSVRWDTALKLAQKISAPVLYFPGAHNCAYDLPKEFACMCLGMLWMQ